MPSSTSNNKRLAVGITMGDPGGIGPEIVAKAIKHLRRAPGLCCVIIGDRAAFDRFGIEEGRGIRCISFDHFKNYHQIKHRVDRVNGQASWRYLQKAVDLLKTGEIGALVTAPVSKEAIALTHRGFVGHTEFLAQRFSMRHVEMMFVHQDFRVVIATRHVPLKDVPRQITAANLWRTIVMTHEALKKMFRIRQPQLAISGLNPHAGEQGLLGREEARVIVPVIKKARRLGIRITGPLAADTLFTSVSRNRYDAFITMYHDQGLTPAKTLFFDRLVNLTIGLPFIRTSPDHGTAFDIAGKSAADAGSMIEAVRLARRLSAA